MKAGQHATNSLSARISHRRVNAMIRRIARLAMSVARTLIKAALSGFVRRLRIAFQEALRRPAMVSRMAIR
jgi:hypothetical protein